MQTLDVGTRIASTVSLVLAAGILAACSASDGPSVVSPTVAQGDDPLTGDYLVERDRVGPVRLGEKLDGLKSNLPNGVGLEEEDVAAPDGEGRSRLSFGDEPLLTIGHLDDGLIVWAETSNSRFHLADGTSPGTTLASIAGRPCAVEDTKPCGPPTVSRVTCDACSYPEVVTFDGRNVGGINLWTDGQAGVYERTTTSTQQDGSTYWETSTYREGATVATFHIDGLVVD